jgi:long-chain acyl-CoA synthetase
MSSRSAHCTAVQKIPDDLPRYESLIHMLGAGVAQSSDRPAVICEQDSLTYAELGRAVAGFASALIERGSRGSRVAILVPNSIETVVAVFGAMAAHAQATPVNPFFTDAEMEKVLTGIDPKFLVCVAGTRGIATRMAATLGITHVLDMHDDHWSIGACRTRAPGGLQPAHEPDIDDLALLVYTGGTTGTPKGVNHHHRTLLWSALQHCTVWPVDFGEEAVLNVAPLFHIWGLGYAVLVSIYTRSTLVLIPKYDPEAVLDAIAEHHVTIFGGGPAPIYAGLLASPVASSTDFTSLKYCLSGGAPCPAELHCNWQKLTACALFEGWGMSEGAPFCVNPANGERKLLSVGVPVPETEVEIVDLDSGTKVLAIGESGEVRVRGPQIMSGYRNNPEETAYALRDGWMYTGDIGYIDDDGYVYLVDRKKDMVIVGGYNVYPREIDELLFKHPMIREAATVGRRDDRLGEVLVAFVALNDEQVLSEAECLDYCRQNLVKYKRPVAVKFIDSLPRTAANKIDKITLRRMAPQCESAVGQSDQQR